MRKVWFEDDYEIRLLRRGKRRLLDIVFGRTMVIVVLLLLQVAIMAFGAHYLGRYYPALSGIMHVLAVVLIIYLVNKPGSATTKITWIVLIMALPAFGVLLYLFVQLDVGHRYANRRVQESIVSTVQYVPRQTELMTRLRTELPEVHNLAEYTLRSGDYPVYDNTAVTYYPMGQAKIGALLDALQSAEHFIFLEYFIIEEGDVWGRILKILEEKVRAGVEVRVLYDGTCTFYRLPYGYPKRMEALGIRCKMFAPLRPFVSTYYNNRDHRKIMVIDGQIAFTGGVNLADEYINKIVRFGYWKDSGIRLEGEGVWGLTAAFLNMWSFLGGELHEERDYYRPHTSPATDGFCQPFLDGPQNNPDNPAEDTFLQLIGSARRFLYITTPYFIPDENIMRALCIAGDGGVDVRLMLPGTPDHWYADAVADSYIGELLEHHVKVYRYTPGFLHAKSIMVDREAAFVGSVNFDYRSFELHYECGVMLYGASAIESLLEDMDGILDKSHAVTPEEWAHRGLLRRMFEPILRVFSIWM